MRRLYQYQYVIGSTAFHVIFKYARHINALGDFGEDMTTIRRTEWDATIA